MPAAQFPVQQKIILESEIIKQVDHIKLLFQPTLKVHHVNMGN